MSAASGRWGGRSRRRPEDWRDLTGRLPPPCHDPDGRDLLWQQFEARLRWYDRAAARSRRACLALKTVTLAAGATVTVLAAAGAPAVLTASLAAGAVVAEGIEQVFQLHPHWISYRSTAETLRQHGFSFAAGVVPYDVSSTRRELLNSVLWAVTSKENADWAAGMRGAAPPPPARTADDEPVTHA